MSVDAAHVLEYWFGDPPSDDAEVARCMKRWYSSDPKLDAALRRRFGPLMIAGSRGELEHWCVTPNGRLALILLLDQFPRNVHRGTRAAFAQDDRALGHTLAGIEDGSHQRLSALQRVFFYMPMQHAESAEVQERSVRVFEDLARSDVEPHLETALEVSADYARLHRDIIARFGRFPHRNAVLGRDSTQEEVRYLERGAPSFGQS
jgi:uncharacterized protein (DUF924 family)